ncbi:MAG: hypothetical protein IJW27_00515 [Clostridia bacterium]|nr:hypothetical protein [Clostridia bacterium]
MDELSEKLSSLLSDPQGMDKIKEMAQNLLGQTSNAPEPETDPDPDIGKIAKILSLIKGPSGNDDRVKLLLALKPNLSKERQQKVDSAIKILKLIELAPLLKDAGIF